MSYNLEEKDREEEFERRLEAANAAKQKALYDAESLILLREKEFQERMAGIEAQFTALANQVILMWQNNRPQKYV